MSTGRQAYDIVIVGGGLVGTSLALMLAELPLNILLLEKNMPLQGGVSENSATQNFDARSTALSYGSRQIYQRAGLWSLLEPYTTAIQTVHTSQQGSWGSVRFEAAQEKLPALGYVIENQHLGQLLWQQLQQMDHVTCAAAALEQVHMQAEGARLCLQPNNGAASFELNTQLLILADGAQQSYAKQLGIQQYTKHYQQVALIANVCCELAHAGCAFERFTKRGSIALLPLGDYAQGNIRQQRMALVWILDKEQAAYWQACPADVCLKELHHIMGDRLGSFTALGQRTSFPLSMSWSQEQVRTSLVVMGNAAHALHPIAGQGFNLALRDCAALSHHLKQALADKKAIGCLHVLEHYYRRRLKDQKHIEQFSNYLPLLFSSAHPLLKLGRGLGLLGLDLLPALRSRFVSVAAGLEVGE